jgi:uncharacterized membrane protein
MSPGTQYDVASTQRQRQWAKAAEPPLRLRAVLLPLPIIIIMLLVIIFAIVMGMVLVVLLVIHVMMVVVLVVAVVRRSSSSFPLLRPVLKRVRSTSSDPLVES